MNALAGAEDINSMALATVVDVEGSAYRGAGARMLILHNGNWIGSISGGCLEGNALRVARQVMLEGKPQLITYDTKTDENARVIGASLGCNGVVKVWIEPFRGEHVAARLQELQRGYEGSAMQWGATMLEGIEEEVGRMFVLSAPGMDHAEWEDGVAANFVAEEGLQRVVFAGKACLFAVEKIVPATRLLVFGGGEDARPMVQLAAGLGWRVTVTDECAAKVLPVRFPEAESVQHLKREEAVAALAPDGFSAAVVMSHNYGYDAAILNDLKGSSIPYIGLLGPRKRLERMDGEFGGDLLEHPALFGPVGLDIGAQTPMEIALAVVAEVQAVMANRTAGFLRDRSGFIHDRKAMLA